MAILSLQTHTFMLPGPMPRFQSEGCKVGPQWLAPSALDGSLAGAPLHCALRGISTAISAYLLESYVISSRQKE